ncbi:MAG: hypothetical protein KME20_13225 [Kaiparowitsia implicata GSE-PSE-MK54-09C]|jgi:hypothetical protein|nr:hypothetical protein [Kaiparowitsia implicata GSE-PSE-MK54-09C]
MYPTIQIPEIPPAGEYWITLNLSKIEDDVLHALFKAATLGFKPQICLQEGTGDLIAVLFYQYRADDSSDFSELYFDEKAELNHLYGDALQCCRGLHKRNRLVAA